MIICDIRKGLTHISGNIVVICGEAEELIKKIKKIFVKDIGEHGAEEMMQMIFKNAMLSEEERVREAEESIKNVDEEVLAEFDAWFKKFMKEGN